MRAKFTFLGTGSSVGIPRIGCSCAVCVSEDPCNQRLRPSGVIEVGQRTLLIDIGPDFRSQALRYGLSSLDGLLLTHTHYDHIAGIDELRIINEGQKKPFPCLLSKETHEELKVRYYYLFKPWKEGESAAAQLDCQVLPGEAGEVEFLGVRVQYISYWQGGMKVNGYRIGDFAYVTDIRDYDDSIFSVLRGVKKLVVSALRKEPSRVGFSIGEAVAFARRVEAKETWITHLSHSVDHKTTCDELPSDVQLGCDGLEISFGVG